MDIMMNIACIDADRAGIATSCDVSADLRRAFGCVAG